MRASKSMHFRISCIFLALLCTVQLHAAETLSVPVLYLLLDSERSNTRFITSFGNNDVRLSLSTIDVASTGEIFVNNFLGPITHKSPTYKFNSSYLYEGTFKDNENNEIRGDTLVIDGMNTAHLYSVNSGRISHTTYTLGGIPGSAFTNSDNAFATRAIDRDENGINYLIPCCGTGSGDDGRYLFVWKLNDDFSTKIASLEKEALLAMLPALTEENDVTLNDIKALPGGEVLISVDLSGANNSEDGILILDGTLNKIAYIGGDWLFNNPFGIDFNSQGDVYIASTYANEIVIYNYQTKEYSTLSYRDIPTVSTREAFLPTDLTIANGKLYIINAADSRIYVFQIL